MHKSECKMGLGHGQSWWWRYVWVCPCVCDRSTSIHMYVGCFVTDSPFPAHSIWSATVRDRFACLHYGFRFGDMRRRWQSLSCSVSTSFRLFDRKFMFSIIISRLILTILWTTTIENELRLFVAVDSSATHRCLPFTLWCSGVCCFLYF